MRCSFKSSLKLQSPYDPFGGSLVFPTRRSYLVQTTGNPQSLHIISRWIFNHFFYNNFKYLKIWKQVTNSLNSARNWQLASGEDTYGKPQISRYYLLLMQQRQKPMTRIKMPLSLPSPFADSPFVLLLSKCCKNGLLEMWCLYHRYWSHFLYSWKGGQRKIFQLPFLFYEIATHCTIL